MPTQSQRIEFEGAFGDTLVGRVDRPVGRLRAYALFAHCFTCSKDLKSAHWISRGLASHGVAVLRFDFTGLGESEGDFARTTFSSNLDDLLAAASYLRTHHEPPGLLVGHSLGGAAVMAAASRLDEPVAVATIGAPSDTDHLRKTLIRESPELREQNQSEVTLGGRTFRIRRPMLNDLAAFELQAAIGNLDQALLIFHAPFDHVVGIDHARRIFEAAEHPKSFVSLDTADHLLTNEADAGYVADVLAAWARRYFGGD